jgi:hypothetical protein
MIAALLDNEEVSSYSIGILQKNEARASVGTSDADLEKKKIGCPFWLRT